MGALVQHQKRSWRGGAAAKMTGHHVAAVALQVSGGNRSQQ